MHNKKSVTSDLAHQLSVMGDYGLAFKTIIIDFKTELIRIRAMKLRKKMKAHDAKVNEQMRVVQQHADTIAEKYGEDFFD